jgi:branched-chain amino acid transport system permease protein
VRIVMSGAGAAGTAILKLFLKAGASNVVVADYHGILHPEREDIASGEHPALMWSATHTNSEGMRGSLYLGDAAVEKYRLIAVVVGVLVFGLLLWTLTRTKIGLLIRAGVQDREMVESLGYRIRVLFIGVFVVGSALAGLGGVMWGLYQQSVTPQMGAQVTVLIFIVLIIGGLGSTTGALIGALLVGLMANYTGFLVPKAALFSNIALMMAVLLWRPQGVYALSK